MAAMFIMLLQTALGGAIGATARALMATGVVRLTGLGTPIGTLTVNLLGSFAMGALVAWLGARPHLQVSPFLITGVLGGFTTFSAFANDSVNLWQGGAPAASLLYIGASVGLSVLALLAGMALVRGMA